VIIQDTVPKNKHTIERCHSTDHTVVQSFIYNNDCIWLHSCMDMELLDYDMLTIR
jgi:hypothetical protein